MKKEIFLDKNDIEKKACWRSVKIRGLFWREIEIKDFPDMEEFVISCLWTEIYKERGYCQFIKK